MVNTVTNTRLVLGERRTIQHVRIVCVGNAQETDLIVYDSSVVATALGIPDPLTCTINRIQYSSNSLLGVVNLEFDATTDVSAFGLPGNANAEAFDFTKFGGLHNSAGTGITGDINLTTTGLVTGDVVSLVIDVRPS